MAQVELIVDKWSVFIHTDGGETGNISVTVSDSEGELITPVEDTPEDGEGERTIVMKREFV
jgi:hypothetical protein